MLNDLEELQQESDEEVWGSTRVSFSIQTREDTDGELVRRQYTFSHADKWDKWVFFSYEEYRTDDAHQMTDRNWRRVKKFNWSDPRPLPEIPPEVNDKLKELLEVEELNIQTY